MNRVIKFRFYGVLDDDGNKTMTYGDNWAFDEYLPINDIFSRVQNDDVQVMQFTGILDRNGKEIYEGDIVRGGTIENKDCVKDMNLIVEYNRGVFEPVAYITDDAIEVIGNIYENKDLL